MRLALHKRHSVIGLLFMLPGFLGFLIFIFVPLLYNLYYSAFNSGGQFALLDNYQSLFNSHAFLMALRNTGLYLIIAAV
ncbi:MAG: hypothetical protein FWG91_00715 [Lachnospiraceae bacterium]|nr:hypothetical protein [Lachnospiraceae bacterium]